MQEPDYAQVFFVAPAPLLVLDPDLTVVAANRACLATTGTTLGTSIGRSLLDVLPGNPPSTEAIGPTALEESLERARATGRPTTVPAQRYDRLLPDGGVVARF